MIETLEERIERRKFDHITVPERRATPAPVVLSPAKQIAQAAVSGKARSSSSISKEEVDRRIIEGLDRLIAALDARERVVRDEEVLEVLHASPAAKQFAFSTPCWAGGTL